MSKQVEIKITINIEEDFNILDEKELKSDINNSFANITGYDPEQIEINTDGDGR